MKCLKACILYWYVRDDEYIACSIKWIDGILNMLVSVQRTVLLERTGDLSHRQLFRHFLVQLV